MAEKLFPAEIMEYTAEYHFNKYTARSLFIYQLLLLLLAIAGLALFLIKVDVSVTGVGILRDISDNNEVKSIVSGRIEDVLVSENQAVRMGQVLARIRTDILDQEKNMLVSQQSDLGNQMNDLRKLASLLQQRDLSQRPVLLSSLYSQQFSLFWQRVSSLNDQLILSRKTYERYKILYNKRVISAAEYDETSFKYQKAKTDLDMAYDEQAAQWQQDLNALTLKTGEMGSQLNKVNKESELYVLQAPSSGTVRSVKGFQRGSMIGVNEVFAEISPDSGLIVETYVAPKDIGYLKVGTPVSLQVDAYNYNQWGMATAQVQSISPDIFTDKQTPYFKVRCRLNESQLSLKNGYIGKLHKGMTLQARFFVTRRTLFQLLYDKTDDWLNPSVIPASQAMN